MGPMAVAERVEADQIRRWIEDARDGETETMGPLLESCRQYLTLVARHSLGAEMRAKAGASDLVQETFLQAQRHLPSFRGRSREELLGWLRRILECRVANARRHHLRTKKRAAMREVPFDAPGRPCVMVACLAESPVHEAMRAELSGILDQALDRLPERARQAVLWRQRERCSWQEIGDRLDTTAEGARKLWGRAIVQLRRELDELA